MVSMISTPAGIAITGPKGIIRVARNHPAFKDVQGLVRSGLPAGMLIERLDQLLTDPMAPLKNWFYRHGITLEMDEDQLQLSSCSQPTLCLERAAWIGRLNQARAVEACPVSFIRWAHQIRQQVSDTDLFNAARLTHTCVHVPQGLLSTHVGTLAAGRFPGQARPGDLVDMRRSHSGRASARFPEFLVHVTEVTQCEGMIVPTSGYILGLVHSEDQPWLEDTLSQPMVLDIKRTYKVEEGAPEGWLEDSSTDSLKQAYAAVKEINGYGSEARIVNRITGQVLPG